MSGQAGIRGYMPQSMICVLESFKNHEWTSITLEPNFSGDKVDVLWDYPGRRIACQVKSSQNQITKKDCVNWVNQLESSYVCDEYELILIGPVNSDVANAKSISNTRIPTPHPLNIPALLDVASNRLDKFLEQRSISKVPAFARAILIGSLVAKFEEYSTKGEKVTRIDFSKTLDDWILSVCERNATR